MKRTTAPGSVGGLYVDRNPTSGTTGTKNMAEDRNNVQEEICHVIEDLGLTLDGDNLYQLKRAVIGWSKPLGELFLMETDDDPGVFFPAVRRNVDVDISTTNYPVLVPKLRAQKTKVDGQTDFVGTVTGSKIVLGNSTPAVKMLKLIQNEALVAGWLNQGQVANFTADYTTAATRKCVNINGVDYPIESISFVDYSVTVVGTPTAGTQTAIFYPYRIAGEANKARLPKLSGFVPVGTGDADGEVVQGWRRLWRTQGHWHGIQTRDQVGSEATTVAAGNAPGGFSDTNTAVRAPKSDGTNGTPQIGKTTDPRTAPVNLYTWAQIYNAA